MKQSKIITTDLINSVVNIIRSEIKDEAVSIDYEIQDDYQFLLLSIKLTDNVDKSIGKKYKKMINDINSMMPTRENDYSWMINFLKNNEVIDSYFGGDLSSPDSGL